MFLGKLKLLGCQHLKCHIRHLRYWRTLKPLLLFSWISTFTNFELKQSIKQSFRKGRRNAVENVSDLSQCNDHLQFQLHLTTAVIWQYYKSIKDLGFDLTLFFIFLKRLSHGLKLSGRVSWFLQNGNWTCFLFSISLKVRMFYLTRTSTHICSIAPTLLLIVVFWFSTLRSII